MVVTGANNELGQKFVNHFNEKGFNLIMVDSDQEALEHLKNYTQEKSFNPDTQVQAIAFDLKKNNHWQDYEALCK